MINLYLGAKIQNSFNPAKYFAFFLLFLKDCRDNKPRQPFLIHLVGLVTRVLVCLGNSTISIDFILREGTEPLVLTVRTDELVL